MARKHLLTLFTNPTCHLCTIARSSLQSVAQKRAIEWREVNIMQKGNEEWYDKYCFDVPVIHASVNGKSKLMHWIYEEDVLAKLEEVEGPEEKWKTTMGKKRQ